MRWTALCLVLSALLAASRGGAAELPFHGFLEVAAGARVVDDDTFFGQFEDDTNVYGRVRYSY